MIEIPEAAVLSLQIANRLTGRTITAVETGHSAHKLAWYYGEPAGYERLAVGGAITGAVARGGFVEIAAGDTRILFSEGIVLRLVNAGEEPTPKRQIMVTFDDGSALTGSVRMYGGVGIVPALPSGQAALSNEYYERAVQAPSPISDEFTVDYLEELIQSSVPKRLSAKAVLATEQRVPGLGNGVLQDILFEAHLHPKAPLRSILEGDRERIDALHGAVVATLRAMVKEGGRDTEIDLNGSKGGYHSRMSRLTVGTQCPACEATIAKGTYMGGSIYFCPRCQSMT